MGGKIVEMTTGRKYLLVTFTILLIVAITLTTSFEDDSPINETANQVNLTVTGASPGGLWSSLGVGLDKVANAENQGATITYQTSSGGLANAKLVSDQRVPLGIISDIELKSAWKGTGVFKDNPQKDLRVLFRLYSADSRFQAIHLIMNRDFADKNNITSFADIIWKKPAIRAAVNRPGNMDGDLGIVIFESLGASIVDIEAWGGQVIRAATREQTNLMTDRRLDLINFGVSYNHSSIRELSNAVPLLMLDITETVAKKVVSIIGGKPCVFKTSEYEFLQQDAMTICTGTVLIASKEMNDETAYSLTMAMVKNLDAFKSAHQQLAIATTLTTVAEASIAPRHPGAERALREAGLIQ
jgi:TRAP transporter TAXI family solute receptor